MTGETLPLVFAYGERAVCHAVDPGMPARQLLSRISLYLAPGPAPCGALVWRSDEGARLLDLARPIGEQVPADALIEIGSA